MKANSTKSPHNASLVSVAIMIICTLLGGTVGYLILKAEASIHDVNQAINHLLCSLGPWWYAPGLLLLTLATLFYLYGRRLLPLAMEEDEVFSQANRLLSTAMVCANIATPWMFLAMALSYAAQWGLNWSVLLLVLHTIWMSAIQALVIGATKKIYPEKRGNVFDRRFHRDWYESCDEAERQQIAQCSYQSFKIMTALFPGIMAVLAIFSVMGHIPPTYSLLVGGLWLVQQFIYNYICLKITKH